MFIFLLGQGLDVKATREPFDVIFDMQVYETEKKRQILILNFKFLQFIIIYIKTKHLFKIAKLEKRANFPPVRVGCLLR